MIKKEAINNFLKDFYEWFLNYKVIINKENKNIVHQVLCIKAQYLWNNFDHIFEIIKKELRRGGNYLYEFKVYLEYIKKELNDLYEDNKRKDYKFLSYLGQKETNLFLYIYSTIEKIIYSETYYFVCEKNKRNKRLINLPTTKITPSGNFKKMSEEDKKKTEKKLYKDINLVHKKFDRKKELQNSLLWGNIEKGTMGIEELRNSLIHRSFFSNIKMDKYIKLNKDNIKYYQENSFLNFWIWNVYLMYILFYIIQDMQTKYWEIKMPKYSKFNYTEYINFFNYNSKFNYNSDLDDWWKKTIHGIGAFKINSFVISDKL